ncbi:ATP-binding protein [Vibrio vulnificus]|nr:AAA family ATPase [Vibrio parahaemolyticus]EGR3460809.1 ATP-binding protein [Vibrio parahaemolyticus]RZQ31935.1 ATP-binding protein [Vibrio vulnificus]RZQ82478.1 ATP-binding protein [Vibrio vulnificus]HAS8107341.1 ATP-binding protein [Vibrio vulnificus]
MTGNPMIEALGLPLLPKQFIQATTQSPNLSLDISTIPPEHHGYYTRTLIDNLSECYVVQDEAPRLYDTIFRMMERGYIYRNPLVYGDIKQLQFADSIEIPDGQERTLKQTANQQSFLVAGLSGRGKSAMVESILSAIPQVISHQEYQGQRFIYEQIVWLKVDIPTARGQRALLWRILESIDSVTGENYYESHQKSSVTALMIAVRKALLIHGVGLIVLDEAQNLSETRQYEKVGNNENATLKFVEELFNKVGVPLLLVGTLSTLNLFSKEMTAARRIGKTGSLILEQCDVESSFWKRFIKQMCPTQLLKNQTTDTDTLTRHIHYLSAGIPAIASSLIKATMSYLTYLTPNNQDLSIAALDHVFKEQFVLVSGALTALKRGQFYKYEDCNPLSHLHSVQEDLFSYDNVDAGGKAIKAQATQNSSSQLNLTEKDKEMLDNLTPEALLAQARKYE